MLFFQVGHMIQAESDTQKRDEYLQRLMDLPYKVLCLPPLLLSGKEFISRDENCKDEVIIGSLKTVSKIIYYLERTLYYLYNPLKKYLYIKETKSQWEAITISPSLKGWEKKKLIAKCLCIMY